MTDEDGSVGRGSRVFLSYATEDRRRADDVMAELEALGARPWLDERELEPGAAFVARISSALEESDLVLVLWSRSAALSRWVELEWNSALSLHMDDRGPRVVFARLDGEPLPALVNASRTVDLTIRGGMARELEELLHTRGFDGGVSASPRIEDAEIVRARELDQALESLQGGRSVLVLAPRLGGSKTFLRHLRARLTRENPGWLVVDCPAGPLGAEHKPAYLERMRARMRLEEAGWERHVVCLHTWSPELSDCEEQLAQELRVRIEDQRERRPLAMVAVGGFALRRLRYGTGPWSLFTNAEELWLGDFCAQDVQALAAKGGVACGSKPAREIVRRTGGHPYLVRLLLRAMHEQPRSTWAVREQVLENDRRLLGPALGRALDDGERRAFLARCLEEVDGVEFLDFVAESPEIRLWFDGILRPVGRNGRKISLRCAVVRKMVERALRTNGS